MGTGLHPFFFVSHMPPQLGLVGERLPLQQWGARIVGGMFATVAFGLEVWRLLEASRMVRSKAAGLSDQNALGRSA